MKTKIVVLFGLIGLFMTGCFIKSLNPFYTKKDIVYDPKIIGTWVDDDSDTWTIKQQMKWPIKPDSSYQVEIVEKDGSMSSFNAHLFKLNKNLYLDFYPNGKVGSSDLMEENMVLTHSLAKVQYTGSTIKIQWFNEFWLAQLFEQNKIRIRHETMHGSDETSYLLTASTGDLQKFIIKYGDDPQAFKSNWEHDPKDKEKEACTFILKKISNEVK